MFNLIKMELYRLFKSTSTWVLMVLTVLLTLLVIGVTSSDLNYMKEQGEKFGNADSIGVETNDDGTTQVNTGFYFDTSYEWINNDVNIAEFVNVELRSCILLILFAIFAAVYVNAENKSGFVKNLAGRMRYKGNLFIAKLPSLLIFTLIEFLIMYIVTAVGVRLFIGEIDLSISADMAKTLAVQMLLSFAFICMVAFLTVLSKGTVLPSVIGIVFAAGMANLLWAGVNIAAKKLGAADDFTVAKYTLVSNIQLAGSNSEMYSVTRAVLVAVIFIAVSCAASFAVMNKRDIR